LQRVAWKQAQQDQQVEHQQVREFAFPVFPAAMRGQQVSHHLARVHLLQGGSLDLLAQLVSGWQLRYLKRHRSTPFWLMERRFLPVCQNWSPFSTYLSALVPSRSPLGRCAVSLNDDVPLHIAIDKGVKHANTN